MAARFPGNQLNFVPRPRAPPRLIRPPSPLTIDRPPQPIVPDVSLIMDSAATSFQSNNSDYVLGQYSPPGGSSNFPNRIVSPRHVPAPRSADNTGNSSNNMHFANYYPTPTENSNLGINSGQMSRSRSFSKDDSGNGSSAAELSRSRNASGMNDTSASESLPVDERNSSRRSEPERSFSCSKDHESMKADISSVLETVIAQDKDIKTIKAELQKIVAFQEKFLLHFVQKGSGVSKSVQTDEWECEEEPKERRSNNNGEENKKQKDKCGSLQRKRSSRKSEPLPSASNSRNTSPVVTPEMPVLKNNRVATLSSASEVKRTPEDVSTILRNLQISNVQPPSMYSETSMRSIECPPFADETLQNENSLDLGPSASANGSDSEEDSGEAIVPTQTYYNNLLSTVNRILDPGQKPGVNGNVQVQNAGVRSLPTSKQQGESSRNNRNGASSRASSQGNRTASYSSGASSTGSDRNVVDYRNEYKENSPHGTSEASDLVNRIMEHQQRSNSNSNDDRSDNVVESTKQYLQSIGVQFDSPKQNIPPTYQPLTQKQNYMIQQNVYNSYYIPTVNCVPVIPESVDSNSGLMDNLARKYITSGERQQYEMMAGKRNDPAIKAETTVYGMTPGNLSFATKEYLQRHGLVGQMDPAPTPFANNQAAINQAAINQAAAAGGSDKILDMTAIRNQPKLM